MFFTDSCNFFLRNIFPLLLSFIVSPISCSLFNTVTFDLVSHRTLFFFHCKTIIIMDSIKILI